MQYPTDVDAFDHAVGNGIKDGAVFKLGCERYGSAVSAIISV